MTLGVCDLLLVPLRLCVCTLHASIRTCEQKWPAISPTRRSGPRRQEGLAAALYSSASARRAPYRGRVALLQFIPCRIDGVAVVEMPPARHRDRTHAHATHAQASGGRRPAAQPGILRFYAEETPGLKIGPTTVRGRVAFIAIYAPSHRWRDPYAPHAQVLVMSVMFVGFVVLLHIYGKLTAVPDAVDEDPIMPETPGADAP